MKSVIFCLLFSFIFISNLSFGQSLDREQFLKVFSREMAPYNDQEVSTFVDKELKGKLLNGNSFSEERFLQMVKTSELIVEKRHAAYPNAYNYVLAFYSLIDLKRSTEEFDAWQDVVLQLLENKNPQKIRDFLQTTSDLFYRGIVYRETNHLWICSSTDYAFFVDKTPFVKFNNTNLTCRIINHNRNQKEMPYIDSLKIMNTQGLVDLNKNRWKGEGGKFTWEKVGLPANETNATLDSYRISFKTTNLTADSVLLKTPYYKSLIPGKLVDRAIKSASGKDDKSYYPQFHSYQAQFEIKNLVDSVDYEGGISIMGNEFVGIGNKNRQAKLTYYRKGKPFVVSYSDQVYLNKTLLKTPLAEFSLYLGREDSIYHPMLNIIYTLENQTIRFARGSSPVTQAPFMDTYHQLNFYTEELVFNRKSNELILAFDKNASDYQRIAKFESFNFYDEQLYQKIQGLTSVHPLVALFNYAWKYDKFEMDEGTAATALGRTTDQAKLLLIELSTLGFISYDTDRKMISINKKTENFVKAKSGKVDYDNISFTSNLAPIRLDNINENDKANVERQEKADQRNRERAKIREYGTIDLKTLDLQINAIDYISIANLTNTTIFPNENIATIRKNRDILFSGWVRSGKWEVKIERGNYNYFDNKFNILESDVAFFYSNPLRKEDGKSPIMLQSIISGVKGELIVNSPNNRSGLKKSMGQYPILISKEKTKVFYDQQQLLRGAYKKDRFYFELEPFKVDSLVTFNEKKLRFPGTLVSAGIFPEIKDELKVMPDYSLGFSKEAPEEGYQFYSTSGKYNHKILLSNNGLQGGGTIDFINSTSTSKRLFTFLPDSALGLASFVNQPKEEGIQFPDANGPDVFITFLPYKEVLIVKSNNELISLYDGEAKLKGRVSVRKRGMNGGGTLDLPGANSSSDNFRFTRWNAFADTSNFSIKNKFRDIDDATEDPFALRANNVKGNLDFKERKGTFTSNEGESIIEFPANQYICKINNFVWFMDKDELLLEKKDKDKLTIEGDMDMVGNNFFSTHPKQDSLQFRAPKARFDLKERTIYAYNVDYIEVADARIYPDSSKIVIRKKAKMEKFKNASIVANFITKYHNIINVNAEVTARKAYTGNGDYVYENGEMEKQLINLSEIKLDPSFQTIATGKVDKEKNFRLSNRFSFYGNVTVSAANPNLYFNGATKLNHSCEKYGKNWMAFESPIDPKKIQIPIGEDMKDLEGNKISVGIRWRNSDKTEQINLYPTFLSAVESEIDPNVISASGYLQYDSLSHEFQIASKEKLINRNETGNYISLHTQSCSLNGEGKISLGMEYGLLETEAVGVIDYNQLTEQTNMNITLAIRAPLYQKAFESIGEKIRGTEGLKDADFNTTTLEQALVGWTDLKTADKIKSSYTLKKEFKSVPKYMQDAIVISGLKLTSYAKKGDQQRGLKSSTDEAIIVNIFKEPVMKSIPLKFFAEQRAGIGDRLGLLLDIPGSDSYFIDYDFRKSGIMSILTRDGAFLEAISKLNTKDKKDKSFTFDVTDKSVYKSQFLRVFN